MIPQVSTCSVRITELLQVRGDSFSEIVFPNVALYHSQYARALSVAYLVEQFLDFIWVLDLGLDWVSGFQAISPQGTAMLYARTKSGGFSSDKVVPNRPLWISVVDCLLSHEGGEALVEPDVIPPFHGHQVAKPHVSNLMRYDSRNSFLDLDTGILVHMQEYLSIRNRPPVLHRSVSELR